MCLCLCAAEFTEFIFSFYFSFGWDALSKVRQSDCVPQYCCWTDLNENNSGGQQDIMLTGILEMATVIYFMYLLRQDTAFFLYNPNQFL